MNILTIPMILLALACGCGAALAADEEPLWKVRRPADNTVLPSEFVHRPEQGVPMDPAMDPAMDAATDSSMQAQPSQNGSEQAQAAEAGQTPEARQQAQTADQGGEKTGEEGGEETGSQPQARPAPAADLGRAGPLQPVVRAGGVVLLLPLDRKGQTPRSFDLKQPARLVYDLPGPWDNAGPNVYRVESPWVEKIVLGEHPDYLRLVVYLHDPYSGAKMEETVSFVPEGLRIEISER